MRKNRKYSFDVVNFFRIVPKIRTFAPMKTTQIELLSPAKDCEVGIAAINHGADAVYIGGPDFGAREKASNSI